MTMRIDRRETAEIWTFDRPAVANAIDRATVDALEAATDDLERRLAEEAEVPRGLILASAPRPSGRAVFLSGADLGELAEIASADDARRFSLRMTTLLARVEALPIVVVAAIAGDVYGGGCELVTACDLRIAERGVRFSFRQAQMGLSTGWGGTTRLVHLVGLGAAKRLLLTGLACEATDALRVGLVDEVVAEGEALSRAQEIVRAASDGGRRAVAALKRGLHEALAHDRATSYARELDRFVEAWSGEEHRSALARIARARAERA
jgi:enoyl-CoA hydratase